MNNAFVDNERIEAVWMDGVIAEPNITTTEEYVCHTTRSIDINTLKVGDKLTLKVDKAFLGYGLYWSTRRELAYGPLSFALKGVTARKVRELDIYTWYRTGDMEVQIDAIDVSTQTVYITQYKKWIFPLFFNKKHGESFSMLKNYFPVFFTAFNILL